MKRYFGLIVVIVIVLIGGVSMFRSNKAKAIEAEKAQSFSRIQREYFERVPWIRSNPDEKSYRDEVGTFLKWYGKEVNQYVNDFKLNPEYDDYLNELEARGAKDSQLAEKKKAFETVKKTWDVLKSGNYEPIWTATDKGMRLDVVSTNVKREGGQDVVQFQLMLWGAQRQLKEDGKQKRMDTSAAFNVTWKLYDPKGKLVGEMTAAGDPHGKIDYPERFIPEFPAQILLGSYPMDLLPAEAAKSEITFAVTSRSPSGGDVNANFVWKLDTPPEWKLQAGQAWQGAQESVRPEDEIDPAKKGQARK